MGNTLCAPSSRARVFLGRGLLMAAGGSRFKFLAFFACPGKKNNTVIEVFSEPFIEAFRSRFQCFHTFVARRGQRSRRAKVARSSGPPDFSYARAMRFLVLFRDSAGRNVHFSLWGLKRGMRLV